MLKAEVNGKMHQVSLMAAGELKEVTNDVALVINGVYSRLAVGAYPETAELFKEMIVALCTHPDTPPVQCGQEDHRHDNRHAFGRRVKSCMSI